MNVSRSTGKAKILLADAMLGFAMINGVLVASVASNNLTVAIKTKAGSDPSAGDPVYLVFRNATAATGDYTVITLAAATSFTVNSGATLGTTNATPFRLWVVGFNDAGTFRLGLVNCSTASAIFPLDEHNARSSTGGTGGSSAGTYYTGTAVATKAFRILGYLEWSSGLTTAGTWASGPSAIQLFGPSIKKPGDVVQMISATTSSPIATTSTSFQSSNLTLSITPTSAANSRGDIREQRHLFGRKRLPDLQAASRDHRPGGHAAPSPDRAFRQRGGDLDGMSRRARDDQCHDLRRQAQEHQRRLRAASRQRGPDHGHGANGIGFSRPGQGGKRGSSKTGRRWWFPR